MSQETEKQENSDWVYWAGCIGLVFVSVIGLMCCILASVFFAAYQFRNPSAIQMFQPTPPPPVDFVKQISQDPKWKISLSDDYTDNRHKWAATDYQSDSIDLYRKIDGGEYIWEFDARESYMFWDFPEHKPLRDFTISAEFDLKQGSSYSGFGFVLRATNDDHYFFEIDAQGKYSFALVRKDEWTTLIENKTTYYFRPNETNQIAVQAQGSHFEIFVNGYHVDEVEEGTLRSGYNGILLSPAGGVSSFPSSPNADGTPAPEQTGQKSEYVVDNFKLWLQVKEGGQEPLTPETGRILFTSDAQGNLDLYSIQTDGKDLTHLTSNPADDYAGKWSPNGARIVFVSERDGDPELYVAESDGSNIERLTDDPSEDTDPSWSPDGTQIVFMSTRDGNAELYLYTLANKKLERLTDNSFEDRSPNWSPDARTILFQSTRGSGPEIFRLELSSRLDEKMTASNNMYAITPIWSPDGKSFIYVREYMNMQSTLVIEGLTQELHQKLGESTMHNLWPAWSPFGKQVAYVTNRSRQIDIYIISADGELRYRLTDDEAEESYLDWTH